MKGSWGVRLDPARAAVVRAQLRAMRAAGDSLLAEEEETTHRKALLARFAEADRVDSVNSKERKRLLRQHSAEVEQLVQTRLAELGWTANDDGCGAINALSDREDHQAGCYRAVAYERSCMRHVGLYWLCTVVAGALWAAVILPHRRYRPNRRS